ncbi:P-loop containing nucleoside triphosphate hydrolase protein [Absidia repens]|uniref:p-loop containing nucleoside triphosphate hydrolase protein n=1 Tax=Absidia repens TaxID=90262 RepID=A0A1X2ILH8_9FUNG|nr:P-loop containing nucleoside triphosphate hydrolase protein [Absidia repens]
MLRSLFNLNGSRVCLAHRRSYAIMDRAKTRAGISLDKAPIKPPKHSNTTQQKDSSQNAISYRKPKDRSLELQERNASRRFRGSSRQPTPSRQIQSGQQKSQQNSPRQRYTPTEQTGYQHPLKNTLKENENVYDPWAPTELKVVKQGTTTEAASTQNGKEWTSDPAFSKSTMPSSQAETPRSPLSSTLRDRIKRLNHQKAAGMAERLIKPIKDFTQPENPHFIKVAVIGAPNAGKSTLVNKIVGEEVSIVSSKSHTTRERILAILSEKNYQVVFLDTPGIISPKSKENMNRSITTSSWRSLDEADHVLIMMDSKYANTMESQQVQDFMMERLSALDIPATLLFNKMDIIGEDAMESLEKIGEEFKSAYPNIHNQLYISALEEDGINDVKNILFASAKAKAWVYPPEQTVEISDLKRVEELIRVEFFKRLHRYIPYMLKQENMVWAELANGTLRIEQNVYVERDSQHKIVVGANGMIINRVVEDARSEISKAFKRPIQLFIQVKTRKN